MNTDVGFHNLVVAFLRNSKSMLPIVLLLGGVVGAKAEDLNSHITGTVERVDQNGVMWLVDTSRLDTAPVAVRQWALEIEPAKLELLTLGRRVTCTLVYNLDDMYVAICVFEFRPKVASNPLAEPFERKSISVLADRYGLGVAGCSEEDKRNGSPLFMLGNMCEFIEKGIDGILDGNN